MGEQLNTVMSSHAEQLQNLNINRRIVNHVQLIEHVESGNQLIDHVTVEKQLMTPVCGEDQMMDHVDGHTLSTVPLTVGCPDPSMLSNIFQDTVAENFIEFSDSENHPSFLTPASSVFTSGVYSSSSNQFSSPTSLYAGIPSSTHFPLLRTPVYSSSDTVVYTSSNQFTDAVHSPVYHDGFTQDISVQELDCINLQPSSDLNIPLFSAHTLEEIRLDVLSKTWTQELNVYLEKGTWTDLSIRCRDQDGVFQTISAHRMMLGAVSPLIISWLTEVGGEEDACIILPEFSSQEVQEFLAVIYLLTPHLNPSFNMFIRCLTGSNELNLSKEVKGEETGSKHESRSKRKLEVKLEELEQENKKYKMKSGEEEEEVDGEEEREEEEGGEKAKQERKPETMPSVEVKTEEKQKNSKEPFTCHKCGKVFKERRVLKEHENLHSEPKFECMEGCGKKFHTKSNMRAHADVVHLKKKNIPCEICGKMFYNASLLKVHKETHSAYKLTCRHCPATFSASKTLRNHIRTKHTTEENVPKCYICQKSLASDLVLRNHIARVHFHEKNCVCAHCGKSFFEKSELNSHLATHNPSQNVTCEICSARFKNKRNLSSHMKSKHGDAERKHVCDLCGKSFFSTYHLNRHMDGHKQKTCFCKICEKGFGSEAKVREHHRKVHERKTKKKEGCCSGCGKRISDMLDLEEHTRTCIVINSTAARIQNNVDHIILEDIHIQRLNSTSESQKYSGSV